MNVIFSRNPDSAEDSPYPGILEWTVRNVIRIVFENVRTEPQANPVVGCGGDELYVPVFWSRETVVLSDEGGMEVLIRAKKGD